MKQCSKKVMSGKKMADAIQSLGNVRELSLGCTMVLHEGKLLPVLMNNKWNYDVEYETWI